MSSPAEDDIRVGREQLRKLSLSDFYLAEPVTPVAIQFKAPDATASCTSESSKIAVELRTARDRFAAGVPLGGNRLCSLVDRAAVLSVYQEALKDIDATNYIQIQSEANIKVQTVLGLRDADPHDAVFVVAGMLLSPLEPQYAEPRIEYQDDEYGYKAAWRLKEWRKDGWPNSYPRAAVEREKSIEARGSGRRRIAEPWKTVGGWDKLDWGDSVDANPGSWEDEEKEKETGRKTNRARKTMF